MTSDEQVGWFEGRTRLTPNKTAFIDADSGQSWTFAEMNERAGRLARDFALAGVAKGDRIALLAPNHIAYIDFLFACTRIGAIFVPLNWRLGVEELRAIVADCSPKLLGYHEACDDKAVQLNISKRIWIGSNDYLTADKGSDGAASGQDQIAAAAEPADGPAFEDPWMMIYTGGTTGKPKGVVLSHRAVWWNAVNTIVSWGLSDRDVALTCIPMFHTGGLNALSIPVLMAGGAVAISVEFQAERTWRQLEQIGCTVVLMVPTMYHMVIQHEVFQQVIFNAPPLFLSGGAPCPHTIYEVFARRGYAFKEGYGLTEAGPNNFYISPQDAAVKRGSVGKAMLFNQIRIEGPNGQEAAAGVAGELLLRGGHVFSEYWNNPEATEQAMDGGWLHTGDLAMRDKDGFTYIVGRKKDMIISGGENIYPMEIEQVLDAMPEVREAAVVGMPDEKWGEAAVGVVCFHPESALTAEQLTDYCRDRLARYKVPKRFEIWDSLPKTAVGKIDKKEIKSRLL